MKIETTPCPKCAADSPTLKVELRLVPKPVGSFSLAGVGMKFSAQYLPVLTCERCDLHLVGKVEIENGKEYATFNPKGIYEGDDGIAPGE